MQKINEKIINKSVIDNNSKNITHKKQKEDIENDNNDKNNEKQEKI